VLGREHVWHTGYGPVRSVRSAARLAHHEYAALAVAGLAGGLGCVRSGEVVVASEVRGPSGVVDCSWPALLVAELRRHGVRAHCGPIATVHHVVHGRQRRAWADCGALAVDMESAQLLPAMQGRPRTVVRVVADTPTQPLCSVGTPRRVLEAWRVLRMAATPLRQWAQAVGPRRLVLEPSGHDELDLVLLVDAPRAQRSRVRQPAHQSDTPVRVVSDVGDVALAWLRDAATLGIATGTAAVPARVDRIVNGLRGLGPLTLEGPRHPAPGRVTENPVRGVWS
jgi:4-hydroxy-3-methylbut-2-enyl diphosphate reductase